MAILLYCALRAGDVAQPPAPGGTMEVDVAQPPPAVRFPTPGIAGAPVESLRTGGLIALYSELEPAKLTSPAREYALQFHRVVQQAFQATAVVSFRFPTWFASRDALQAALAAKASVLEEFLSTHADVVQMEISLSMERPAAPASGTEYLQSRRQAGEVLESAAAACRAALGGHERSWRQRASDRDLRCFALLARADVEAYRNAMQAAVLPGGVRALVSGPWPPNEFLEMPS